MLQDKNYIRNEDIANSEHLQDDNEDDIYESPVHIAPPSPMPESILNSDCQNSDINDNNDSCEESSSIPKKKGPWVDAHFPLPPPGVIDRPANEPRLLGARYRFGGSNRYRSGFLLLGRDRDRTEMSSQ